MRISILMLIASIAVAQAAAPDQGHSEIRARWMRRNASDDPVGDVLVTLGPEAVELATRYLM
jgi:hypothetical protein